MSRFKVGDTVCLRANRSIYGTVYKTFEEPNRPVMVHFSQPNGDMHKYAEDQLELEEDFDRGDDLNPSSDTLRFKAQTTGGPAPVGYVDQDTAPTPAPAPAAFESGHGGDFSGGGSGGSFDSGDSSSSSGD